MQQSGVWSPQRQQQKTKKQNQRRVTYLLGQKPSVPYTRWIGIFSGVANRYASTSKALVRVIKFRYSFTSSSPPSNELLRIKLLLAHRGDQQPIAPFYFIPSGKNTSKRRSQFQIAGKGVPPFNLYIIRRLKAHRVDQHLVVWRTAGPQQVKRSYGSWKFWLLLDKQPSLPATSSLPSPVAVSTWRGPAIN